MVENPIVKWEKWTNPFGIPDNELDEYTDEEDVDDLDEDWQRPSPKAKPFVMFSNYGSIPLNFSSNPLRSYNWWVAYLSWPMTAEDYEGINNCLGVETLDYFSSYRFRIGIAKLCDEKATRKRVTDYLVGKNKKK